MYKTCFGHKNECCSSFCAQLHTHYRSIIYQQKSQDKLSNEINNNIDANSALNEFEKNTFSNNSGERTSKVRVCSQCVRSYVGVLTDLIKTTMTTMAMTRTRTPTITPTTISVV